MHRVLKNRPINIAGPIASLYDRGNIYGGESNENENEQPPTKPKEPEDLQSGPKDLQSGPKEPEVRKQILKWGGIIVGFIIVVVIVVVIIYYFLIKKETFSNNTPRAVGEDVPTYFKY